MFRFLPGEQVVQDFVEDDTAAPDVALDGVGFAEENLRGHVDGRADAGALTGAILCLFIADHFGEPEVRDFDGS